VPHEIVSRGSDSIAPADMLIFGGIELWRRPPDPPPLGDMLRMLCGGEDCRRPLEALPLGGPRLTGRLGAKPLLGTRPVPEREVAVVRARVRQEEEEKCSSRHR
jgi:hypothetical protein